MMALPAYVYVSREPELLWFVKVLGHRVPDSNRYDDWESLDLTLRSHQRNEGFIVRRDRP